MEQREYLLEEKELEYEDPGDTSEKEEVTDDEKEGSGVVVEKEEDEELL